MWLLFEYLTPVLAEFVVYRTGRAVAPRLFPGLAIEPLRERRPMPTWRWRGFTYAKEGQRYFHTETLHLLGWSLWIVLPLVAMLLWTFVSFI